MGQKMEPRSPAKVMSQGPKKPNSRESRKPMVWAGIFVQSDLGGRMPTSKPTSTCEGPCRLVEVGMPTSKPASRADLVPIVVLRFGGWHGLIFKIRG